MSPDSTSNADRTAGRAQARVSRRGFLAAAGAGALAGSVPAAQGKPAGAAWEAVADVIVVGSGAAAYTAAVCAAHRRCRVLMLEKAAHHGGTTLKSGGGWWVPNNGLMRRDGIADPREDAIRYLARCAFPAQYNPALPYSGLRGEDHALLAAYYDNAFAATDELEAIGALRAQYYDSPTSGKFLDYYAHFPENKAPRGRCLTPAGTGDIPLTGGVEMINQLSARATALGVELRLSHPVQGLVQDDQGRVIGVEVAGEGGARWFGARKAVVFGSGGFTHNPGMADDYLRGRIFGGCAVAANTGDFVHIAARAGAALGNMSNAWWSQIVLEQALVSPSVPNNAFNLAGDSSLLVNRRGRRIVNEKSTYNERTQSHFVWDPVTGDYPNLLQFFVYDARTAADPYGFNSFPVPAPGLTPSYVLSGMTLAELAENIRRRLAELADRLPAGAQLDPGFAQGLEDTVRRFNRFADTGRDEDFRRGENPIDTYHHSQPNGKPNTAMHPLADRGPYYAIILAPGTLDTKGGPKINTRAQVLRADGQAIPGLYGAGNCIASPAAQAYWSGGATLGCAIAFGYLAGRHAAQEPGVDL